MTLGNSPVNFRTIITFPFDTQGLLPIPSFPHFAGERSACMCPVLFLVVESGPYLNYSLLE